jgi:hypothetical protein
LRCAGDEQACDDDDRCGDTPARCPEGGEQASEHHGRSLTLNTRHSSIQHGESGRRPSRPAWGRITRGRARSAPRAALHVALRRARVTDFGRRLPRCGSQFGNCLRCQAGPVTPPKSRAHDAREGPRIFDSASRNASTRSSGQRIWKPFTSRAAAPAVSKQTVSSPFVIDHPATPP